MDKENKLKNEIAELDAQIEPKRKRLHEIWSERSDGVKDRIKHAEHGNGDFKLDELRFAATWRCACGAGMCYPKDIDIHGSWECSAILLGRAVAGSSHDSPFAFYEAKSEEQ